MTFLKNSLITLTILVISIWVITATSTDDLKELKGYCRDIFKTIGFKDDKGDYEKIDSTGETLNNDDKGDHQKIDSTGKTLTQEDYKQLLEIYNKMETKIILIGKDPKTKKDYKHLLDTKGELRKIYYKMEIYETKITDEDIEKIKTVTTKFETDFKNYLKEKCRKKNHNNSFITCFGWANGFPDEPVTAFCESKIKKNN